MPQVHTRFTFNELDAAAEQNNWTGVRELTRRAKEGLRSDGSGDKGWPIKIRCHPNRHGNRGGKKTFQGEVGGPHQWNILPERDSEDGQAVPHVWKSEDEKRRCAERIVEFAVDLIDLIVIIPRLPATAKTESLASCEAF